MGDFDKLGFEVEVEQSSFDTTISRLDTILKKLEEIDNYEKKVGRSSSSKNRSNNFSTRNKGVATNSQIAREDFYKAQAKGIASVWKQVMKAVEAQTALNNAYKEQAEILTKLTSLAQEKLSFDIIAKYPTITTANAEKKISELQAKIATTAKLLENPDYNKSVGEQAVQQARIKEIKNTALEEAGLRKKALSDEAMYLERVTQQKKFFNSETYKTTRAIELENQALKKKIDSDLINNNQALRSAEIEAKVSQLRADTARQTELMSNSEWQSLLAIQTKNQYQERSITQMASLIAEQEALNNGKWEEARAIELANKQRKQEIDTRLRSQLGLKEEHQQVQKNTNVWSAYLTKITSVVMLARRLGSFFAAAIQEGASYTENLVLFSTAFGESTEKQLQWAENLAKSYGLARNEVVKFAGTFRELANSLGMVGETADYVTRTVTNLGYDLSALFNTSVTTAMEKLQAGIFTGQTKPLRYYGIDISQESIDRLIETDSVLKELGVSARDLSQSEKTVARLLITMRSASNSFGTMAKEINNLQSQFRIFQGSLSEFKLAIGNLVQEPLRNAMVYINGFIIALTNIINGFAPQREDKTIFDSTTEGAENTANAIEDANKQYDELTGKLAGFDKFNVLQQSQDNSSTLAVTEQLNKLLSEEAVKYEEEVQKAMDAIKNEAVEIGKAITDWFVVMDDKGKFEGLTTKATGLLTVITSIGVALSALSYTKGLTLAKELEAMNKPLTGLALSATNLQKTFQTALSPKGLGIMAFVGAIAYMYTTNEKFRESLNETIDRIVTALRPALQAIGLLIEKLGGALFDSLDVIADVAAKFLDWVNNSGLLEPALYAIIGIKLSSWLTGIKISLVDVIKYFGQPALTVLKSFASSLTNNVIPALFATIEKSWALQGAIGALGAIAGFTIFDSFLSGLDATSKAIMGLISVLAAGALAWMAYHAIESAGVKVPIILTAVGVGLAGIKGMVEGIQGFADGGYTNANLIMTHENGKREWVGKAAGSAAIVNDTQMSDIMETAVAKGVYRAFSNSRTESSSGGTTKNVYNFQVNGRTLLSVMEDEARKQGKRLVKA
jgi:hypothetical protein